MGPGPISTEIRSNYLGDGVIHKLVETAVGLMAQSPEAYAKEIVPILFAPELEGRTGILFGSTNRRGILRRGDQPILPTEDLDDAYVDRFLSASEGLLRRALS